MEVIGLAASVATLADLADKGLQFRKHFKNAAEELSIALSRVDSLSINLNKLRRIQDELSSQTPQDTGADEHIGRAVKNAVDTLERIYRLMPRAIPHPALTSKRNRLRWVISDKATYDELMILLAQTEISINTTFNILAWDRGRVGHARQLADETEQLVRTVTGEVDVETQDQPDHSSMPALTAVTNVEDANAISSNIDRKHLWGFIKIAGTSAYSSSAQSSTWVGSMRLHLPAGLHLKLCLKADINLQTQYYPHGTTYSLARSSLTIRKYVPPTSPFLVAAGSGAVSQMQYLISTHNASPHEITDGGITPLCVAIRGGHTAAVKFLLQNGADVDEIFGRKQTSALSWALKHRQLDICRILLQYRASFHHLSIYGWSPLFYLWSQAVKQERDADAFVELLRGNELEFQYLHDGLRDTEGWSLMQRVAIFGTPSDIRCLVNSGVDILRGINKLGWTVLHQAVSYGVVDNFEALFPFFAQHYGVATAIESADSRGWTLLHIAVNEDQEPMARVLLSMSANWEAVTDAVSDNEDVPASIHGVECTPIRLALAHSEDRYKWLVRGIDEIVLDAEDGEDWYDAMENIWHDTMQEQ